MSNVRSMFIALTAMLSLAACETWDRTEVRPVTATVVGKHTRKPSKMSRRYYVLIQYEGKQTRIRDRAAYREKDVGDAYEACLITYTERETRQTRTELDSCPDR